MALAELMCLLQTTGTDVHATCAQPAVAQQQPPPDGTQVTDPTRVKDRGAADAEVEHFVVSLRPQLHACYMLAHRAPHGAYCIPDATFFEACTRHALGMQSASSCT